MAAPPSLQHHWNSTNTNHKDFQSIQLRKESRAVTQMLKCDALRDLVPFVQFKKREKHLWRSVNFIKVADFSQQPY